MSVNYCNSLTSYSRLQTREVNAGHLCIGGGHPIRIQSMTTTDTMDTAATVAQSIRMIEAGAELVRITAPSIHEANNLAAVKKELKARGYDTPLVADIHFTPNAAEVAARIVEKVRVNPGNYADKKKFQVMEYSDAEYEAELDRIRGKFLPLVKICKEYGTAMRIGTNHGSLSDRIMSRYGDTPLGMVESAFEFLTIAEEEGYHNIVLSMKSSNPQVMVQAYRLLVHKMLERADRLTSPLRKTDLIYPLHLGVTEAGDGEDGRIKSAIGIGALLEDGLGDTIRVSLTEDPELELPVARMLANRYTTERKVPKIARISKSPVHPFTYSRRQTHPVENNGANQVPVVVMDFSQEKTITPETLLAAGYRYDAGTDKWNISDMAADYLFTGSTEISFPVPGTLGVIRQYDERKNMIPDERNFYAFNASQYVNRQQKDGRLKFVMVRIDDISDELIDQLKDDASAVVILDTAHFNGMMEQRRVFFDLISEQVENPVIIRRSFENLVPDELTLYAATDFGALLLDGLGDGIWLHAPQHLANAINRLCFGILQGTRLRISKTEYISCPSCGRTLFDLQETTAAIRARTNHLKGIKIAIMGCIVNGPGEMADADYGYVGSGVGKITLYKGKEVVKRAVESTVAVEELIALIKENGDWVEMSRE
ncbi:MAG: (E)-4-hydroxy-3-methylbut-2-enyl-diphosphate synthase [Chitinophagales bacterium]|nr:(E)-4-hydroxy-3-methylbut-2-enyl-diphosphate synthase [Chitinophagales bacterium]